MWHSDNAIVENDEAILMLTKNDYGKKQELVNWRIPQS